MDPLSALSLAGTIIQFADFGSKLLSESLQLYKSSRGTLDANEQLELVTADLQSVIAKLRTTSNIAIEEGLSESTPGNGQNDGNAQNEEDPFEKICGEAMQIAEELLTQGSNLYLAPSWSWASMECSVNLLGTIEHHPLAEVVRVYVEPVTELDGLEKFRMDF